MTETWTPVKGKDREYWKPEKAGDERIGTLLRGEAGEYKDKPTMQYVLDVDGTETYTPNHAKLNTKLLAVKAGCRVKIVYMGTGEKKNKGRNAAEMYDVFYSDAPRQTGLNEESVAQKMHAAAGKEVHAERMRAVMDDIRLYCKLDHIIPEEKLMKICGDEETFKHLRDQGLILLSSWDKVEGWRAT